MYFDSTKRPPLLMIIPYSQISIARQLFHEKLTFGMSYQYTYLIEINKNNLFHSEQSN